MTIKKSNLSAIAALLKWAKHEHDMKHHHEYSCDVSSLFAAGLT